MSSSKKNIIVVKYGGNAMIDQKIREELINKLSAIHKQADSQLVLVHGGGPFIKKGLSVAGIHSEFFNGHRITSQEAISVVEKILKGEVNSELVSDFIGEKINAVGLSGKDGAMVEVIPRKATDDNGTTVDLGRVGDVKNIDTALLHLLLENNYLPVIACIGADNNGNSYNVNADMMAGAVAGQLNADYYTLTNVDGLYKDIEKPDSKIESLSVDDFSALEDSFTEGMIPKMESCKIALENGALSARILNGMKPDLIQKVIENPEINIGTKILK